MKSGERMSVRCGCFGASEEDREECVSMPREDQEPTEELQVSSFVDPEAQNIIEPLNADGSLFGVVPLVDVFISSVASRPDACEREYGNRSFARPPWSLPLRLRRSSRT